MRKKTLLAIIILLGVIRVPVFSQTTQGTDFWVSFGSNGYINEMSKIDLKIKVAATEDTEVNFIFTANNSLSTTQTILAGQVYTFNLSTANMKNAVYYADLSSGNTSGISNKSLHIKSTKPITAYAYNRADKSADVTNLLPIDALCTDYVHISYTPYTYDGYTIVATEDDTDIYEHGNTTPVNSVPLKMGEVYSFYAQKTDLTGKHITANHPIAYFVTNTAAFIPSGKATSDNLFQQMMPMHTWGKAFFVPATNQGKDRMRVVAAYDNTKIIQTHLPGATSVILNKGQFYEWEIVLANSGCYFTADKPVGVCSYLVGQDYATTKIKGDPSMSLVTPIVQWVDQATIAPFVISNANITDHHIMVITPKATRDQTTVSIGGAAPTALSGVSWTIGSDLDPNEDYAFCTFKATEDAKAYTFANPAGLTAKVYGVGDSESYFYSAVAAARDLSTEFYVNDILYLDLSERFTRGVSNYRLKADLKNVSATPSPGYLKWFVDDVESPNTRDLEEWTLKLMPNHPHTIRMDVEEQDGVTRSYSCSLPACDLLVAGGTDFWLAFGANGNSTSTSANLQFQVRVTAIEAADLTFTFTNISGAERTLKKRLAAGEIDTLDLSALQRTNTHSPHTEFGISNKSLRIESTTPVRVLALNQFKSSADITNILPVSALGTEYYLISHDPDKNVGYDGIIIIATKNGTMIYENNIALNATPLSAGQIWVNYKQGVTQNGRHITSNKPVACFVANTGTYPVPAATNNTGDNLFQQMMPVHLWGKEYCVPVTNRKMERIRVIASQDGTTITQTGGTIILGNLKLDKGQFVELEALQSTGGCFISADKPVGVCTFMCNQSAPNATGTGDASMAWVPSIEQFITEVVIRPFIPASTYMTSHYALIVAPTSDIAQTTLYINGIFTALNGTWTAIPGSQYSFCTQTLTIANASKPHVFSNPKGLLVYGYGTGTNESYYYLSAASLMPASLKLRIPVNPPKIRLI
ncbi:MAG: IgGFc-binding protein [Candidatus Symbiothrix sp.]|jgi:hypothetical protein|nr:IgGFc-binding protein [Candidatus Symbiothrix sp.]